MFFANTYRLAAGGISFLEKLIAWFEQSVLYELLVYFKETYFTVQFHVYEYIPLAPSDNETAQMMIFGIAIGAIIAVILIAYTRTKLGDFLRKLIANDCLSPEHAKTLSELGDFRNASVRRELARGVTLRKFVKCREEEEFLQIQSKEIEQTDHAVKEPEIRSLRKKSFWSKLYTFFSGKDEKSYRIDFTTAHFYMSEDLKYRAEVRFERKGSGLIMIPLTIVCAIVFVALTCRFLPDIVQLMDNIIGQMAP